MLLNREERLKLRQTWDFNSTNKKWNDLKLNHKKNIGCLMFIAKKSKATTFEEWEKYYFSSGRERKELLKSFMSRDEYIRVNNEYGRTEDELLNIAKEFKKHINLPLKTLYNFVYIRVIDETWIGLNREITAFNIIKDICSKYEGLDVYEVDYHKDITYAVDFEIKMKDKIILAIQLKSMKYFKSKLDGTLDIKTVNAKKNRDYTKKYNADVLYLYIGKYDIVNIDELIKLLDKFSR